MKTFKDLEFQPFPPEHDQEGERARLGFSNGYEVSVIRGPHTYGGPKLYELMVLCEGELDYDNPISSEGPLGYLTPAMVSDLMEVVQELPAREEASA